MRIELLALVLTMLLTSVATSGESSKSAPTFHDCELVHNFGRIVIVAYCPAGIATSQLVEFTVATKGIWLQKYGFVQYFIYSTKDGLPKSMNEIDAKSDAWFEKYELAMASFNSTSGHKSFACRKGSAKELSDCSNLLR